MKGQLDPRKVYCPMTAFGVGSTGGGFLQHIDAGD